MASKTKAREFVWQAGAHGNYILAMPYGYWRRIHEPSESLRWHKYADGAWELDHAAIYDGCRMFLFVREDLLYNRPAMHVFATGTINDFYDLAGRSDVSMTPGEFDDPLEYHGLSQLFNKYRRSGAPEHLPIIAKRIEDFRAAFGDDAWTSRFPRKA